MSAGPRGRNGILEQPVVKVDRRIRWHYTTTILRLRIGARLTRYRNCKFHNGCRTISWHADGISRHADGISRYSVPPSAGPLLPLGAAILQVCVYVKKSANICWRQAKPIRVKADKQSTMFVVGVLLLL